MTILSIVSRQPRRLTLAADTPPPLTVTDYAVARQDGGYTQVAVSHAWLVGVATVELSLTQPLAPGVIYTVSVNGGPAAAVSYFQPANPAPAIQPQGEDPAAEAYGVDYAWLTGQMTADGDVSQLRGRPCLLNDIAAVTMIAPLELYHRPDDGVGLMNFVNAPGIPLETDLIRSRMTRQYLKDTRISTVDSIDILTDSTGKTTIPVNMTESITGEQITVNVPGGE